MAKLYSQAFDEFGRPVIATYQPIDRDDPESSWAGHAGKIIRNAALARQAEHDGLIGALNDLHDWVRILDHDEHLVGTPVKTFARFTVETATRDDAMSRAEKAARGSSDDRSASQRKNAIRLRAETTGEALLSDHLIQFKDLPAKTRAEYNRTAQGNIKKSLIDPHTLVLRISLWWPEPRKIWVTKTGRHALDFQVKRLRHDVIEADALGPQKYARALREIEKSLRPQIAAAQQRVTASLAALPEIEAYRYAERHREMDPAQVARKLGENLKPAQVAKALHEGMGLSPMDSVQAVARGLGLTPKRASAILEAWQPQSTSLSLSR